MYFMTYLHYSTQVTFNPYQMNSKKPQPIHLGRYSVFMREVSADEKKTLTTGNTFVLCTLTPCLAQIFCILCLLFSILCETMLVIV